MQSSNGTNGASKSIFYTKGDPINKTDRAGEFATLEKRGEFSSLLRQDQTKKLSWATTSRRSSHLTVATIFPPAPLGRN